jgi:hypothetical protein
VAEGSPSPSQTGRLSYTGQRKATFLPATRGRRFTAYFQLEIAEKFLFRGIEFIATQGHKLELDKTVLPFLVRKGFHPKLGARPTRDAVEKLVGDAVAECLLSPYSFWDGRRAE